MDFTKIQNEIDKVNSGPSNYAYTVTIDKLSKFLEYCYNVYQDGTSDPVISDDNYDIMLDILEERDPFSDFIKKIKQNENDKYAMPSLNKIRSHISKEFENWYSEDFDYQVSDKLDGISAKLIIRNGKIKFITKGRGGDAKDITNKIDIINFNTNINLIENLAVRGEIIISKSNSDLFINEKNKISKLYKNLRAAVSGIMNNKVILNEYKGLLDFVVHFRYDKEYNTYEEMLIDINSLGFKIPWNKKYKKLSNEECIKILNKRREESDYIVDGIVIAQNVKIKNPTNDNPKEIIAFKDISETAQSKVIDVIWSIGQYGYLSPTLIIEPVTMNNSTINNVFAHNAKYVIDNEIGIGSIVEISHEIVPQIQKVILKSKPKLPVQEYEWNSNKTNIICKEKTEEQQIMEVKHFFKSIDVKYMSDGIITTLNCNGYDNIIDIINAEKKELYKIRGLGNKIIDKIYENMDKSLKSANLENLMAGSCLFGRNLGKRKLKILIDEIPNIMNEDSQNLKSKILEIKGFSDTTTKVFIDNLDDFKKFLNKLIETGKVKNYFDSKEIEKIEITEKHPIDGLKIVFTNIRPDKNLNEKIINNGGLIMTTVSKKTNVVVCPSTEGESNNIKKAKQYGIRIIELKDFVKEFF